MIYKQITKETKNGNNTYSELKDFIKDLGNKQAYDLQKLKWWLGY